MVGRVTDAEPDPRAGWRLQVGRHQNVVRHKVSAAANIETGRDAAVIGETDGQIGEIGRIAVGVSGGQTAHHAHPHPWCRVQLQGRGGFQTGCSTQGRVIHVAVVQNIAAIAQRPCV